MIEHGEIDGIPTVFSPREGASVVGLSFRVGMADETLPQRGITHMVEHLALHRAGLSDYHANGQTGSTVTTFHVGGSPQRVHDFMELACTSLNDLPLDRLDMERAVIKTEEAGRTGGSELGIWRHGATGYGAAGYPEYGIASLTPEQVRDWSAQWFTRDNAILWAIGPELPSLALPLPSGARRPLPPLNSAVPELPAFFVSGGRHITFDAIITRSTAARACCDLLTRILYQSLRTDSGLSYAVDISYEPIDGDRARVTGYADALEANEAALVGQFIDTLAATEFAGITQRDLDATKERFGEGYREPHFDAGRLPYVAIDLLLGGRLLEGAELLQELEDVTLDQVREAAAEIRSGMLVKVPAGTSAEGGGYAVAPHVSAATVEGTSYPTFDESYGDLVVGAEGITLLSPDGPVTVRFDEVAVATAWPDGAVRLIGVDGFAVLIEPTLYDFPPTLMSWLADRLPGPAVVALPSRDPQAIPQRPERPAEPVKMGLFRRKR